MKKQNLNEEISRIKGIMGKIMTESFEDMQSTPEQTTKFKVGDTVSDPSHLNPKPEYDGKILAIYPNLEAVAAEHPEKYENEINRLNKYPDLKSKYDVNDVWYLIKWKTEGTNIYSKSDADEMIIAPDGRDYDDYDEEGEDYCSCCNGSGEGAAFTKCRCCGGSGVRGGDDGPEPDYDENRGGHEYGSFYDGT